MGVGGRPEKLQPSLLLLFPTPLLYTTLAREILREKAKEEEEGVAVVDAKAEGGGRA